jgi:hypothetical protein
MKIKSQKVKSSIMKKGSFVVAVCAMLSLAACNKERVTGNGSVTTETRNISGFTAVSASGSTPVHITQGAIFKLEIRGSGNLLPYYETKLVNNELQLGYEPGVNVKNDNTEVFITMPVLNGIRLAGSGSINTTGDFAGNTSFHASIEGSGNIHFSSGTTQQVFTRISGSGNIYAAGLVAINADTETTGSGNTELTASTTLKARIIGSGNVYYYGHPVITTNISGSGAVIPR